NPAEPPQRPREIAAGWMRRGATVAAVLCVAAVLVAGWQHPDAQRVRQEAHQWLAARLGEADNRLGAWSDALQVRYYDRRAEPAAPGLPLPTVTPAPDGSTGQGGGYARRTARWRTRVEPGRDGAGLALSDHAP